jgi:hypothetical protein
MIAVAACLLLAGPAAGAVRFAEWSPDEIGALLARAAAEDRYLMVVITQPDWCPGCIALDRALLRNPEAAQIATLTREWIVLEVLGYDEPDASFLANQGVAFLGTPTTLLLKPGAGSIRLGEARQVSAIVGYPDDYLERLSAAAAGHDAIAAAIVRHREANDVESMRVLADAYLAAGDAGAARRVLQSLVLRPELDASDRRAVALEAIVQPTQRIEKDHLRTLEELAGWLDRFPEGGEDPDYIYALAWSTLALGRQEEAMAITQAYLSTDQPGDLANYLYLVFRHPSDALLADAERRAREGAARFPEQASRFHAAHGRILRRQGRLVEAEKAFSEAVAKAEADHPGRETYLGQLEFIRQELAAAAR